MLTYERAQPEDLEILYRMNEALVDQYETLSAGDYEKVIHWVRQSVRKNFGAFQRILCDGQTAGYYCLVKDVGKWELDSLFILPEFQGRGIGAEIVAKCRQEASPLYLYVYKGNTRAVALYRKMGFRRIPCGDAARYRMKYRKPSLWAKIFRGC